MEEKHELKQQIPVFIEACTAGWRCFILGQEKEAMKLTAAVIDFLGTVIGEEGSSPLRDSSRAKIILIFPRLLKALEERNGMILADILEYELKPALAEVLE